ncbi:hypothetical protein [Caproicibacter fermentans]|uniref:Uncharacterized protein n=1 Tax=Caproicibacter fermentans TaxID=2576756 RepID=A0A7G8TD34_9FIRM|nr:hypothetical protein [Caproicibacter fermentans]QNK41525.1 hypothetical protein HCR03_04485 [Caproicibacter fermentans]
MKKLSLSRARELVKRELGISTADLFAPPDMNGNPNYPWYMMTSGTMLIEVHTEDFHQGKYTDKMVALCVTHENSSKGTIEYFYGDTLEYAAPYTDWNNREAFCEGMEDPQGDAKLCRLKREAMDSCWGHFHQKTPVQIGFKAGTLLIVKNNHAVFDRYDGFFKANPDYKELAQHFICNGIPAQDSRLRFIGNGKLAYNDTPVYVLQDPVNKQVFLYDAKCTDGLEVSSEENQITSPVHEIQGSPEEAMEEGPEMSL